MVNPLQILVTVFTILIFTDWPVLAELVGFPAGLRHILLVTYCFLVFAFGCFKTVPKMYTVLFSIVLIMTLVASQYAQNGILPYVLGFVFTYLFVFVFIGSHSIQVSQRTIYLFLKFFVYTITFLSIPSFLTGVIQGTNLRWLPGIFRELGAWALCMNLAIVASLSLYAIKRKKRYLAIVLFLFLCIGMTVLKKSIIEATFVITFAIIFLGSQSYANRTFTMVGFILVSLLTLTLLRDELSQNIALNVDYLNHVGADSHVRLGMYLASINIANDFFPFGSGYGSFGSLASISLGYSEVHHTYGVSVIGSNSPDNVREGAHTLMDTFWPHIIAESGYIGSIFYVALYLYPAQQALKLSRKARPLRPYAFIIIGSLTVILMDGLALFSPEIPLFIFLGHGLAGLILRSMKSAITKPVPLETVKHHQQIT